MQLIKTKDYLLWVDENSDVTKLPENTVYFDGVGNTRLWKTGNSYSIYSKVIVAHLPLNGSKILDHIYLLPEIDDENIVQKAREYFKKQNINTDNDETIPILFWGLGYKSNNKQFTIEEIESIVDDYFKVKVEPTADTLAGHLIASLKTILTINKQPKEFIPEMVTEVANEDMWDQGGPSLGEKFTYFKSDNNIIIGTYKF